MIREENTEVANQTVLIKLPITLQEAEVLKKVLLGIKLTVSVGNMEKQVSIRNIFVILDIIYVAMFNRLV